MSGRKPYPYFTGLRCEPGMTVSFSFTINAAGKNGEGRSCLIAVINITKNGRIYNYAGIAAHSARNEYDLAQGQSIALKRAIQAMWLERFFYGAIQEPNIWTLKETQDYIRRNLYLHAVEDRVWGDPDEPTK